MEVAKLGLELLNTQVGAFYEDETITYEVEVNGQKLKFQKSRSAKGFQFGNYAHTTSRHMSDADVMKMAAEAVSHVLSTK